MFAPFAPQVHGSSDPRALVRSARLEDVAAIVQVAASRGAVPDGFERRLVAAVGDPGRCVLVGHVGPAVVGWTSVSRWSGHDDVPDGYAVSGLTVAPDWRRRYVGDRLLGAVLDWSWERATVVRSVVNARNTPSIALHERHGFTQVARAAQLAGITFEGGTGILMQVDRGQVRA
ncbi:N-acetyltransferase family protein [Cellulomonas soli]|uniref:GNAT family N-acetyltransferase n=1 Tax=Cellulomonas soli TaxID=931535 RepID=UPI003F87DEF8